MYVCYVCTLYISKYLEHIQVLSRMYNEQYGRNYLTVRILNMHTDLFE